MRKCQKWFRRRHVTTVNGSTLKKQDRRPLGGREQKNSAKKWTASHEYLLEQKRPRQPVSATNLKSQLQCESCDGLGERQRGWSRVRQSWQARKAGRMDQEDRQHELRQGELPTEPRMGQAFTYWRPTPEVSPDEGFWREAETSMNSVLFWLY